MSYVNSVKEKHRFEKSLRSFLQYINVMSIEEIELSMAHIADDILAEKHESLKLNGLVKGAVLRLYIEMREGAQIPQRKLKRMMYLGEMGRYAEEIAASRRGADLADREKKMDEIRINREMEMIKYRKAHAEWHAKRDSLPFLKKWFSMEISPDRPPAVTALPPYAIEPLATYIEAVKKDVSLEKFFINKVRRFEFGALPDNPMEFSSQQIVALSQ